MSWTRGSLAALVVCVLLLTGSASCGSSDAQRGADSPSVTPVGELLDQTDEEGRRYREVDGKAVPEVGIEVTPDTSDGSWAVRLTLRHFTLSPEGTGESAAAGRGIARLFVDEQAVADLRTPEYRIPVGFLPKGTHHVTVRLYADDGTVWAIDGKPVESTADITASEPQETSPAATPSGTASASASPDPDRKAP
ncbi:hypothetical protein [Streptomyces sp. NPDC018693]|uniref:hypothetical protein n=1 Tax=unclassified Streptomyces TaxID=2593676 RepID=UPI0037B58DE1